MARLSSIFLAFATLIPLHSAIAQDPATACDRIARLTLPGVTTLTAERVLTGTIASEKLTNVPPVCRVAVTSSTAPGSIIHTEIWLPETAWNGRLLGTGTGGGAGRVSYGALVAGASRGFAVANTDLGTSPNANAAASRPAARVDFGHLATHQMTVLLKAIAAAYYPHPASEAYFYGCSTGGEQALSEAESYPTDYNGIIAGAPANNRTGIHSLFLWDWQSTHKSGDASMLPLATLEFVHTAVLHACSGKDGGAPTDPFLTDPRTCHFDPNTLPVCSDAINSACVTPPQLAALKSIFAGPTNPRTGERIYAPLPFGAEDIPAGILTHENTANMTGGQFYPFYWTFGANWNPATFDFDHDEDQLQSTLSAAVNANSTDLSPFRKTGGKLVMFSGTSDPLVPYPDALAFYDRVVDRDKGLTATQSYFRYYIAPGMAHCGGGPGISSFGQGLSATDNDVLSSLESWVEKFTPPTSFPGTGKTPAGDHIGRPVCPYPQFPDYTTGDPTQSSSFRCTDHPRGQVLTPAPRYLQSPPNSP